MPERIQRKRTKGFKTPPNTVYVGRPTKYGNPFLVKEVGNLGAVWSYENWLNETIEGQIIKAEARQELRGKNLSCFCKIGLPCHADVLLQIANSEAQS